MDNKFDLYNFDKWLKENYAKQTYFKYLFKIRTLRDAGLDEQTPSSIVASKVKELCRGKEAFTAQQYKSAIAAYQKFKKETTGENLNLIDNTSRTIINAEFPTPKIIINPPKAPLWVYKDGIPKLRNDDLRLMYMLCLNSGARIGEIANLAPGEIRIGHNYDGEKSVWLDIKPQKTQYGRTVRVRRIDGLFNVDTIYDLAKVHIEENRNFPNAWVAGIKIGNLNTRGKGDYEGEVTHDLRKYCARGLYRQERLSGKGKNAAAKEVMKQLGHMTRDVTVGGTRDNGGYIGKLWLEDRGGIYNDTIEWDTP